MSDEATVNQLLQAILSTPGSVPSIRLLARPRASTCLISEERQSLTVAELRQKRLAYKPPMSTR